MNDDAERLVEITLAAIAAYGSLCVVGNRIGMADFSANASLRWDLGGGRPDCSRSALDRCCG